MFVASFILKFCPYKNLKSNHFLVKSFCETSIRKNMSNDKIKTVVTDILKPLQDNRHYRGLELNNGLKVLLVSDATADKSSAAMDVFIGAMSDPPNLPGLAHFCEHMLFLGTKKYPVENDYGKFLSDHGGSDNASTTVENTNYYFDVAPEFFPEALDRFAQFFICPLFSESATNRELNAINSENDKNIMNDSRRVYMLEKSLCHPGHDFSKFSTGNRETLDTTPKKLGINVRNELLKFHEKYYSSNIMSLVVLSQESLDEMTSLVTQLFCEIKNKSLSAPEWKVHPFGPQQAKKKLMVVPVKDVRSLTITWPIPDLTPLYKSNPAHYLGHLIGHEGPGSLLSELKKRGWVNQLSAGENNGAKGFMFFMLDADLTEEGLEHVDDIVSLAFQYINLLRKEGVKEWIYKECQVLSDIEFKFKDKENPSSFTSRCASVMQLYPLKEVLSAGYYYDDYKPEYIDSIVKILTPENMRLRVVSQSFVDIAVDEERWYGAKYKQVDIPENKIKYWQNIALNDSFHLPNQNDFIPQNLNILKLSYDSKTTPTKISENVFNRLWYCRDDHFKLPKCVFTAQIFSPKAYLDPLSKNYTHLFTSLLKDSLSEFSYSARLAGISYDMSSNLYGLQFSLGGYSDKQDSLLVKVLDRLCSGQVDEKRFDILLENYIRDLKNFTTDQPYQQAIYYTSLVVSEIGWTKEELIENTENMTYEGLLKFIPELFSQVFVEALVYGNVNEMAAREMVDRVLTGLKTSFMARPLPTSQQKRGRQVQLADGVSYRYKRDNSVQNCSSLEMYLQCGMQEKRENMILELLCQIITEPCYDVLRTQEQLGYIVFSGLRRSQGVQGLRIIVQSDRTPSYVETRVEVFIETMKEHIKGMNDAQFKTHVKALASKRLEHPKKMGSQNLKYWSEISTQLYNFERDRAEVHELNTLEKIDVINLYHKMIASDAPKRHKLSVHVLSTLPPDKNTAPLPITSTEGDSVDLYNMEYKTIEVENLTTFRQQLPLFPIATPTMLPPIYT